MKFKPAILNRLKKSKSKIDILDEPELLILTVNTRIPYYYDIPLILGYPNSFYQRFRFKKKWLVESLHDRQFAKGTCGLIVLRDMLNDIHIPIRTFTLQNHIQVDNIHFFDVSLEDIIDFGPPSAHKKNLDNFSVKLKESLPAINNHSDQHPFVYKIDWHKNYLTFGYHNSSETNWGFIVNSLIEKSQYADVPFLKIIETHTPVLKTAKYLSNCTDKKTGSFLLR